MSLAVLAGVASAAEAGPLTVNIGSFSGGTGVIHAPGTLANGTGSGLNVYLGAVLITGDLGTFESYCVDLQHYDIPGANSATLDSMSNWNNSASPSPVPSTLGGGAASWLYNTYALSAYGNKTLEAALSLAIWNALYDNDYYVTTGAGFWVTGLSDSNYGTQADIMLAALKNYSGPLTNYAGWIKTDNLGNSTAQDFIAPVPEPATLSLLGTGLVAAFLRRRKQNQNIA